MEYAGQRRVLILGGARSGKSAEAERRLADVTDVAYVATGQTRPDDPEWVARIAAHQRRRPDSWSTIETTDVAAVLSDPPVSVLLIDCLTLWLTAAMDEVRAWDDAAWDSGLTSVARSALQDRCASLVESLAATPASVITVSNEVGWGVVPMTEAGRRFQDEMGRLNQQVARVCEEVVLVVAGRILPLH